MVIEVGAPTKPTQTYDITVYSRDDLVRDFVNYMRWEQNLSKHTIRNYEHDIAKLDRFLPPGMPWQDVDRRVLRAFLQHLHERWTISTVRRVIAGLRSFYKFLRLEGHIVVSPVDDLPRMKVPQILPHFLEWEQVEALIRAPLEREPKLNGNRGGPVLERVRHRNYALLQLLTATGIRISEAVGLRLGDVQLGDPGAVRVFGKGSKERVLPLHPAAATALADYIKHWRPKFRPKCDYVFVERGGVQIGRRIIQQEIKRYAAQVGIDERTYPHILRHSFATAMVRNGCPLPVVQELLGHVSIATTAIYTHVSPEHLRSSYLAAHPANR